MKTQQANQQPKTAAEDESEAVLGEEEIIKAMVDE